MKFIEEALKRAAHRGTVWHLLLLPITFGFVIIFFLQLEQLAWGVHVLMYPQDADQMSSVWRNRDLPLEKLAGRALLIFPGLFFSFPLAILAMNTFAYSIPPIRRSFEAKGGSYSGAMKEILWALKYFAPLWFACAIVGSLLLGPNE